MPRVRRVALKRKGAQRDPLAELLGNLTGADRAIRFIEGVLTHSKGEHAGRPFLLLPFQCEIVSALYGEVTPEGIRRFRQALLFMPRKAGKSTLSAALGLKELFDGGPGARVVVAANSREQASLLFSTAADAVEASPILSARAWLSRATRRLVDRQTKSEMKVIAADAGRAHGMDLTAWVYDELHEAPNRELYDVLATSTGARRESLGIVISTAGFDRETSILGELYQHAKRVLADPSIDPHFYPYILEAPEGAAWDDEATWHACNPALGHFRDLTEMRIMAERARQIPAQRAAFERLYLNRWTAAEHEWLDMSAWNACGADIPDADLKYATGYGGLDLSANTDLTAFVIAFPHRGRVYVRSFAWLPAENLIERERRDRVPYRAWADAGRIELIPGAVIDHDVVTARVIEACKRFRVRRIAFDRWGAQSVSQKLHAAGIEVVPFGQGFAAMSAPTKSLEAAILKRQLAHGGCPLLRWQASCSTVASDPAGNVKIVKPDRMKHTRRVDSIVALVMAFDGVLRFGGIDSGAMFRDPIIAA